MSDDATFLSHRQDVRISINDAFFHRNLDPPLLHCYIHFFVLQHLILFI